jgi:elongation factor G-like protein
MRRRGQRPLESPRDESVFANTHYPLEQLCSHRSEPFQLAFARQAIEMLPQRPDRRFEATHRGLLLLAETESALESSAWILRDAYGELVSISAPTIRYQRGVVTEEPHMGVRVLSPAEYFDAVRDDLMRRGATLLDAEVMSSVAVVRVTAPLARLFGYSLDLARLTSGAGREVMWLSHYAPVESQPPPGNQAA